MAVRGPVCVRHSSLSFKHAFSIMQAYPPTHMDLVMTPNHLRREVLLFVLLLFITLVHAPAAFAGDEGAKPRVQRLTLFKNGLGFIVSIVTLPEGDRSVRIGPLPLPSFGTFWVGYPEEVKVKSLLMLPCTPRTEISKEPSSPPHSPRDLLSPPTRMS